MIKERLTRWMPLVERDLLTIPDHLISSPCFCEVHAAQSSNGKILETPIAES